MKKIVIILSIIFIVLLSIFQFDNYMEKVILTSSFKKEMYSEKNIGFVRAFKFKTYLTMIKSIVNIKNDNMISEFFIKKMHYHYNLAKSQQENTADYVIWFSVIFGEYYGIGLNEEDGSLYWYYQEKNVVNEKLKDLEKMILDLSKKELKLEISRKSTLDIAHTLFVEYYNLSTYKYIAKDRNQEIKKFLLDDTKKMDFLPVLNAYAEFVNKYVIYGTKDYEYRMKKFYNQNVEYYMVMWHPYLIDRKSVV